MRSKDQLREHYEIERGLANQLRHAATKSDRRRLYGDVYRQRSELIPHHPLVVRAGDAAAQVDAARAQVALLMPFVGPNTRFCELGAGDAAVSRSIAPHVGLAVALDVTDALAPASDPSIGFEFHVFDGFDLECDENSLDVVYSNDVVEHLHSDDMLDQAESVRRALRPGGVYICVTPNRLSGPHDISRHFSDSPKGFHLREYTVTELTGVFKDAGFARVKILLTVGGKRLSPLLPATLIRPVEKLLAMFPPAIRRPVARGLAAVKVVVVK
jgi:SAM-dependent methyltransferase